MTNIKEFPTDKLEDLVFGNKVEGLTLVEDNHCYNSRWEELREIIFKEESTGKYYAVTYYLGLTENQENRYFDDYAGQGIKEVYCTEVKPVEVTQTEYVEVNYGL